MTGRLTVQAAGPQLTVQDEGRYGYLAQGITRGGAADLQALKEAAALLRQNPQAAAIEMVGTGGAFSVDRDTTFALTGAEMAVDIDGAPLRWNASHVLPAGARLTIGGARNGVYGYLSVSGGFDTELLLDARAAHLKAEIGAPLQPGDILPLVPGAQSLPGLCLEPELRFAGGDVRVIASAQTSAFSDESLARFEETVFTRDPRGNRQAVRLASEGDGFAVEGGLSIVSEVITEGDIQITGDGSPYVLMCECQTTGGYPRIATILPSDLPLVAQTPPGAPLRFSFVTMQEACRLEVAARKTQRALPAQVKPILRDPAEIPDLLGYQLISGAISADTDPFES
ncbi:MAG: biotin-dependent carboxyltransferase family protein [Pseudomonadota bacterium]